MNVLIAISCTTLGVCLISRPAPGSLGLQLASLLIAGAALAAFLQVPASFLAVFVIAVLATLSWMVATPSRQTLETLLSLFVGFLAVSAVSRFTNLLEEQGGVISDFGFPIIAMMLVALGIAFSLGGATAAGFAWLGVMLATDSLNSLVSLSAFSCLAVPLIVALDRSHFVLSFVLLSANAAIFLFGGNL